MGLGVDDDLVRTIDGSDAAAALNHALGGGHLGALMVGTVALADRAFAALAVVGVCAEPLAELCGLVLQAGDMLGILFGQFWFTRQAVILAMAGQHRLSGHFELLGLSGKVGTGAALGLGSVAR